MAVKPDDLLVGKAPEQDHVLHCVLEKGTFKDHPVRVPLPVTVQDNGFEVFKGNPAVIDLILLQVLIESVIIRPDLRIADDPFIPFGEGLFFNGRTEVRILCENLTVFRFICIGTPGQFHGRVIAFPYGCITGPGFSKLLHHCALAAALKALDKVIHFSSLKKQMIIVKMLTVQSYQNRKETSKRSAGASGGSLGWKRFIC